MFDVAIVGYGPVGATLANLLGQRGIVVAVLERDRAIHPLPRACHLDDTVLRILQSVGLAETVLEGSIPSLGMDMVDRRGRRFLTLAADHESNTFGYPTSVLFWQPQFEAVLRDGVSWHSSVSVRTGVTVSALQQHDDHVELTTETGDGETEMASARYVVGCDGASSFTRQSIGTAYEDLGFEQPWLVVDVELQAEADLPDRIVQYCDPARPATYVPLPGDYRRWEFMLLPGEEPAEIEQTKSVASLMAPWLEPDQFGVVRGAVYSFHALIADRWAAGRAFLAGDACHQMPPFLGQGMGAGIRDAANLAWKLGLVLDGQADASLLDTYESERQPLVRELIERAIEIGRLIQVTEEEAAAAETFEPKSIRGDSGARPITSGFIETDAAGAGELFPQPLLATGMLDDQLGGGFSVVSRVEAVEADVVTPMGPAGKWLRDRGVEFAVIRPDRYVYSTGSVDRLPEALARLRRRLAG